MYIFVYILPASLLLMKLWGLVSVSWFYCYIMFGACVPEVTQTNPLRANKGLCFLFTRVDAVLFSVKGPRGAHCVHVAYSFGSDTWDSGAPGGEHHSHHSSEWWQRTRIDWELQWNRLSTFTVYVYGYSFMFVEKLKKQANKNKHRIGMKYLKYGDSEIMWNIFCRVHIFGSPHFSIVWELMNTSGASWNPFPTRSIWSNVIRLIHI